MKLINAFILNLRFDAIICLCVDAMLIFSTNLKIRNGTKSFLSSNFDRKHMDEVDVIFE